MRKTRSWYLKKQVHRHLEKCFILTTWRSEKRNMMSSNQPYVAFASFLVGLRFALSTIFVQSRDVHDALGEPSWVLGHVGFLMTLAIACAYWTPFLVIVPLYYYQRKHDVDMMGHLDDDDAAKLSKVVTRSTLLTKHATRYVPLAMMTHFYTLSFMTFELHGSYLLLANYMVQSTLVGLYSSIHTSFLIGMLTMAIIVARSIHCRFKHIWHILDTDQAKAAQEARVLFKHIVDLNLLIKWIVACITFVWLPIIAIGIKVVSELQYRLLIVSLAGVLVMVCVITVVACVTQVNADRKHDVDVIGHLDAVDVARLSKVVTRSTLVTKYATRYVALAMMAHFYTLSFMAFEFHGSYLLLVNCMFHSTLVGLYSSLHASFLIGMLTLAIVVARSLHCRFKRIWCILGTDQAKAARKARVLFKHISDLNHIIKWIIACITFVWLPVIALGVKVVLGFQWYLQLIVALTGVLKMACAITVVACVTQVNADVSR
ncbi:hypothetical protein HDE_09287 [Halotydeus destructor]|nr:hypothetical protein HDE_09287 [Halotydeus destructor]